MSFHKHWVGEGREEVWDFRKKCLLVSLRWSNSSSSSCCDGGFEVDCNGSELALGIWDSGFGRGTISFDKCYAQLSLSH